MSKADRRARKRENKYQGRAEREAAAKRAKQRSGFIRGTIAVVVIVGGIALILFLGRNDKKAAAPTTAKPAATTLPTTTPTTGKYAKAPAMTIDPAKKYTATIKTTLGDIVVALDAKNAPVATNNFVFLARDHFYDGLKWHRVVKDFVIQGGDPNGDGSGGPGYTVKGELPKDGYPIGSLAAAKGGSDPKGTMGSQFFIVTGTGTPLAADYARFGKVTKGMDVVNKIESYAPAPGGDDVPTKALYIVKVSISES